MQKNLVGLFYTGRVDILVEIYEVLVTGNGNEPDFIRYEAHELLNFASRKIIPNPSATALDEKLRFKSFEEARYEASRIHKGMRRIKNPQDLERIELGLRWEKGVMTVHFYPSKNRFPHTIQARQVKFNSNIAGQTTQKLFRYLYGEQAVSGNGKLLRKK